MTFTDTELREFTSSLQRLSISITDVSGSVLLRNDDYLEQPDRLALDSTSLKLWAWHCVQHTPSKESRKRFVCDDPLAAKQRH